MRFLYRIVWFAILAGFGACGGPDVTRSPIVTSPECEALPVPDQTPDVVNVAMLDVVESEFAPWARNPSEQLLFSQLYETLILIDCLGEVRAGLAESWKSRRNGRVWEFEIRNDAIFWDGTRVRSSDVVEGWERGAVEPLTIFAGIDSVVTPDDRTLTVYFGQRHPRVPRALSAPALAVAKRVEYSRWPMGTGPYRIPSAQGLESMTDRAIIVLSTYSEEAPRLRFLENTRVDSRDLLDDGIDMMITGDPRVLDYAAGRDELQSTPLAWQRSYVLFSTSRANAFRSGQTPPQITSELSADLASDAVKTDARASEPGWWGDIGGCAGTEPGNTPRISGSSHRVLYDVGDPIARGLAERIVALSAVNSSVSPDAESIGASIPGLADLAQPLTAQAAAPRELSRSLWSGEDFAYVVSVPRVPPDPCYGARRLLTRAPWLSVPGAELSDVLLPLVDTRLHAITKKAMFGMIVDGYGNIAIVDGSMPRITTP